MHSHFLSHFIRFFFLVPLLCLLLLSFPHTVHCQCSKRPPVIFNFGDSNSDTGGLAAGLGFPINSPNGRIFFHRSTGRFSDGRLLIDLLCKWDPSPWPQLLLFLFSSSISRIFLHVALYQPYWCWMLMCFILFYFFLYKLYR